MFFKDEFSKILSNINNTYSTMTEFANKADFDRTYISKYIHKNLDNPPTPKILEKIAHASKGITTYEELMRVCGYFGNICAERLKGCRLSKNLSLDEVADKVNISRRKLELWENGHNYNMDFETSDKLAQLYNVDISWLIGLNSPKENVNTLNYALSKGIDIEGLNEEDIEEINRFIEFVRNKKKNKKD